MRRNRVTIELVVRSDASPTHEIGVAYAPQATVAQLAEALGRHIGAEAGTLHLPRLARRLDPEEKLRDIPLLRGETIWVGEAGPPPPPPGSDSSGIELVVAGGPAMGARHRLEGSSVTVGRGRDCSIRIDDPALSRTHLQIDLDTDGVRVSDAGSTNGTYIDGVALEPGHRWAPGEVIEAGASLVSIEPAREGSPRLAPSPEGTIAFNRPPRVRSPQPAGSFEVPAPPPESERPRVPLIAAGAPLLVAAILWQLFPDNPAFLVVLTLSPLMAVFSYLDERRRRRQAAGSAAKGWSRALEELAGQISSVRSAAVTRLRESAPGAGELERRAVTLDPSLWLRRADDDDFLDVRVGWGDRSWDLELREQGGGSPRLRKEMADALAPLRLLPSVPLTFSLRNAGVVGLAGDAPAVDDAARWWLIQLAVLHSPVDLSIAIAPPEDDAESWSWSRWLPHARRTSDRPPEDVVGALAELAEGGATRGGVRSSRPRATVLLIHERANLPRARTSALLRKGPAAGIYVVWVGSTPSALPGESQVLVEVTSDPAEAVLTRATDGMQERGTAEGLDEHGARRIALALAPVTDASADTADSSLPQAESLFELLEGLPTPAAIESTWQHPPPGLRALLGHAATGRFAIDLVSDGPHALIGGMTGAGKSELLQTLIASLGLAYPPSRLNLLMIDYKGGAAFKDCARLPHAVGFVTDLDAGLARRALASLEAEIRRRETELRTAGARDIAELEAHPTSPLARLVIVIDEFATLIKELPSFVEGIVDIAQRGRSLGLHLVLATQRPAGAINDAIRANTNLRIALRVADEADSFDVIGTAAAAHIRRSIPGRAYVKTGPGEVIEIQVAQPSAPATADAGAVQVWDVGGGQTSRPGVAATSAGSQLATVVAAIAEAGRSHPPPRPPWLPPLPDTLTLEDVVDSGGLAAIGLLDEPHLQRRGPAVFDLERDGGMIVYGTGGAGKTTLLITLAASLARAASPGELHLYGLDMTSGPLRAIEALPQCGDVVIGDDVERVRRLLFMLVREVDMRKADGSAQRPSIVVLIDGYAAFTSAFERIDLGELVDLVPRLISDGRGVGIHFVITAERRGAVPAAVTSLLPKKVVLRLGDADEYASFGLDPREAAALRLPPGRGFLDGTAFQAATVAADASGLRDALDRMGSTAAPRGARPPRVRGLPTSVTLAEVDPSSVGSTAAFGVTESESAALADLRHGHFLIAGPYRSGRSTALGAVASGIVRSSPATQLHLLAPRRSSVAELDVWTHVAHGADACSDAVAALAEADASTGLILFVDDADELAEGAAADALEAIARRGRHGNIRIVAAAEARSLHRAFGGWLVELRKDKHGLLLDPDLEIDGDLFGVRLPRRSSTRFPPGRGYLVERGSADLVQVAQP